MRRFALSILGAYVAAGSVLGQVSPVAPFTGALREGFETQVPAGYVDCIEEGIFFGSSELCSANGPHVLLTPVWVFNCVVNPHDGAMFAGIRSGGYARIVLGAPVRRFGVWIATNGADGVVTARFYDENQHLLDQIIVNLDNDCAWYWNGWEAVGAPIASVEFENSVHGSGKIMLDDLEADPATPLGSRYCVTTPNSSGQLASIAAGGSTSISSADLVMAATGLPGDALGLFFYGPDQVQIPFGAGFRCIDGPPRYIGRLAVEQANSVGALIHSLDYGSPPSAHTMIEVGSTWNFQGWYLDTATSPPGFNTTDALELTFTP